MSLLFMIFSLISMLCLIPLMSIKMKPSKEKSYSFECGFNPFFLIRTPFSLQFFKILLIFLLFDMEIIIILPLPLFQPLDMLNQFAILMIFKILIFGLYFELKEGSIQWLKSSN